MECNTTITCLTRYCPCLTDGTPQLFYTLIFSVRKCVIHVHFTTEIPINCDSCTIQFGEDFFYKNISQPRPFFTDLQLPLTIAVQTLYYQINVVDDSMAFIVKDYFCYESKCNKNC